MRNPYLQGCQATFAVFTLKKADSCPHARDT